MCTLIALHRCVPGMPLVVAANRDERLDRPAEPPALRQLGGRWLLAPRDREAGGTWLGLNAEGLFAAITNRPTSAPDPSRRSRGLLVLDALGAENARQAALLLGALPARAYNPFNLLLADGRDAFAVIYQEKPRIERLAAGIHVLGNSDPNDLGVAKIARLHRRVEALLGGDRSALGDGLAALCRAHDEDRDPLASPCIHTPSFGTRSSTLLGLGPREAFLRHAEGPPCRARYEDLTPLLERLRNPGSRLRGATPARGAS